MFIKHGLLLITEVRFPTFYAGFQSGCAVAIGFSGVQEMENEKTVK
jgi:hypothetical protein